MMQCVANGHEIAAIANLKPPSQSGKGKKKRFFFLLEQNKLTKR